MSSIDLVEAPEEIFGRPVDIVASGIVGEIVAQRRATEFLPEQINLVEEEDDTRAHEPSRIDDRVEQHQTFHHTVLFRMSVLPRVNGTGTSYLIAFFQ